MRPEPELTCAQCRELLPRFRTPQLSAAERDAITRHIAGCVECRREWAFWSAVGDALAASDAAPSIPVNQARVWQGVRAAIGRESGGRAPQQRAAGGRRMRVQTPTPPRRDAGMLPTPPRRRSVAAIAAVTLIAALSFTLFGVVAPHLRHSTQTSSGPQPTATPAACAPSQLRQSLPANAELSGISMVSARDGWAVGQIWDPSHPATAPQALMLRFQNCQWRQDGLSAAPVALYDVAMASPDDGWAVGATMRPDGAGSNTEWVGVQALLLHYHDGVWQPVVLPGHPNALSAQIRLVSSNDGWLLVDEGKSHPTPDAPAYSYGLYHYDGTAWSAQPMAFKTPSMILTGLAAGPGDLWIGGYDTAATDSSGSAAAVVAHYAGGHWSSWSGTLGGMTVGLVQALAVVSPSSVWVFGSQPYRDAHSQGVSLAAFHYDGRAWSLVPTRNPGMAGFGYTATALPNGEVYIFGQSGLPGSVALERCDPGGCEVASPDVPDVVAIRGLAPFSATRGFAVADLGYVPGGPQSAILYFDGGQWSAIPDAG